MASTGRAEGFSPELRASLFHFTVFGSTGVASAYLAIWLSGKGINSTEIGIINALPVFLGLLLNVLIGRLADKASDWRVAIIVLAAISGVASIGFFFADGFWGLLLVFTATTLPAGSLVPVVDAATLRLCQRRGSDFGFVRAWGTVGYTVATALTGIVIGWFGPVAFVPMFVILSLLRTGLALPLPQFRAPGTAETRRKTGLVTMRSLMTLWFLLPCIAFALLQATHYFLGAMGSLVWKIDGIAEGWIGPLIAISAASEAAMMFVWRKVGAQISARTMMIIAGVVATGRWIAMAFSPSLEVLIFLQLLHGITYPFSYFGIMHFIANWAPEEIAAEAQGFAWTLTQGFAVLTLVAFGWLVGTIGGQAYFVAAAMALLAAGAAWWSLLLKSAHSRDEAAVHAAN